MATKLQLITGMYEHTLSELSKSRDEWMRFLSSASRNYKLPFEEQALVHTQRPDAAAVLELEKSPRAGRTYARSRFRQRDRKNA